MKLQTLKTKLTAAAEDIFQEVFFNYLQILNTSVLKPYPCVAWNLDTASGEVSLRQTLKELNLEVIGVNQIDPETEDFLDVYDDTEELVLRYLTEVAKQEGVQILTLMATIEYYPRGTISNDSEIGIKLKVTLKIVC